MKRAFALHPRATENMLSWVKNDVRPNYNPPATNTIRVADFFSGCGGLSLGAAEAARRAGFALDIRFALDFDKDAIAVYRDNFSPFKTAIHCDEIKNVLDSNLGEPPSETEKSLRKKCGPVDIVLAGPPCQGHSDLNNSTRRDDPRNRLYLRAARAVEVLMPKVAFIENVPGVVHDKLDVVGKTIHALELVGYSVASVMIDLAKIGLPQRRRRHILFATRSAGVSIADVLSVEDEKQNVAVGPFIEGLEDEPMTSDRLACQPAKLTPDNERRVAYLFSKGLYDLPDSMRPPCHKDKPHTYRSVYGRMRWGAPSQTITSGFGSPGQGRFIHPRERRLITPHEAARIQGFPDFYDFSAASGLTSLRTMIGNAVPPPLMITLLGPVLDKQLV